MLADYSFFQTRVGIGRNGRWEMNWSAERRGRLGHFVPEF